MKSLIFQTLQNFYTQFKETYAEVKKAREEKERETLRKNFETVEKPIAAAAATKSRPKIDNMIDSRNQSFKASKRNRSSGSVEGEETNFNQTQRNF